MTRMEPPDYSGIFLEPEDIQYEEIDPPFRNLIRLINSESWVKTYGCCAGQAHHGENPDSEHHFFMGFFVDHGCGGAKRLQSWVEEANRLNGPTGLRTEVESVDKHPFGQGSVGGWYAYRLTAHEIPGRMNLLPAQAYLRMIKCLETAWEKVVEF
ncbi:MAG: hypothetical protein LJE87_06070 [Deltaproteobacteria bacterium]|nr:hypothetical protein [Deltaproteobacteria bacterium]